MGARHITRFLINSFQSNLLTHRYLRLVNLLVVFSTVRGSEWPRSRSIRSCTEQRYLSVGHSLPRTVLNRMNRLVSFYLGWPQRKSILQWSVSLRREILGVKPKMQRNRAVPTTAQRAVSRCHH